MLTVKDDKGYASKASTKVTIAKDQGKIAFEPDRDGDAEIYVMNADSSGILQLTDNDSLDGFPYWSNPYIVYTDSRRMLSILKFIFTFFLFLI